LDFFERKRNENQISGKKRLNEINALLLHTLFTGFVNKNILLSQPRQQVIFYLVRQKEGSSSEFQNADADYEQISLTSKIYEEISWHNHVFCLPVRGLFEIKATC